jgi:hypothetical protein
MRPLRKSANRGSPHSTAASEKDTGNRMSGCSICTEKERLLKEAVMEHWRAIQKYRSALAASEDLNTVDVAVHTTQVKMNRAEDSYRQHLRLMHETGVGTTTSPVSTFTRFYTRSQSEVVGN